MGYESQTTSVCSLAQPVTILNKFYSLLNASVSSSKNWVSTNTHFAGCYKA